MRLLRVLVSALLAGASIAFGGLAYLSLDDRVLGALFFTVGLFTVCSFGFHLFTGKVCFLFQNGPRRALELPVIWVGNLLGTGLVAGLAGLTRIGPALRAKAAQLCAVKTADGLLSLLILGIFCNIFIYLAVEGFARCPHSLGKYLSLFFGVMVFILCGFEHCVADMFYFWMGDAWSPRGLLALGVITLGNALGGVSLPLLRQFIDKKPANATTE